MNRRPIVSILAGVLLTMSIVTAVNADDVEVKRAKVKTPHHPSLRFLRDNRDFLRAQLDALRMQARRNRSGDADAMDPRFLELQRLGRELAAARDNVSAERDRVERTEFLHSVTELGDVESQLARLEQILADQRLRLLQLEQDFLGHQETAMIVLVKGRDGKHLPSSIMLSSPDDRVEAMLTADERLSLVEGGIALIYHEYVEPREHVLKVAFGGGEWSGTEPVTVKVEAARDRITFLQLDLSRLDRDGANHGLLTNVWYR